MSRYRARLDQERLDRMAEEEFAPSRVWDELEQDLGLPDFLRARASTSWPQERRFTPEQWREVKIGDGMCPMPGCSGNLDEDFFCAGCGNVSLPKAAA